ncbi:flagellar motor protein MotB [Rhodanobacter aciditrophus]|uniref:Flagellar motor protein MotB n=1 Tax=Rhodanobacter aciditrophus TaxID=1623218 RepID=A0ABW4B6L7_9GAMM
MSSSETRPRRRSRQLGRRNVPDQSPHKDRWILSYADFITLLFAFFVALYSISLKQAGDEKVLSETLNGVFDAVQKSIKPINVGDPVAGQPDSEQLMEVTPNNPSEPESTPQEESVTSPLYTALSESISSQFPQLQTTGQVSITEDANWITLDMKAGLVFGAGSYELTNEAVALLIVVSNILKGYPAPILVLGNTDDLPTNSTQIPTNWHLSSMRAASVVDELIYRGIDSKRLAPMGFASENPKVRNSNDFARAQNRRVTLKISKQMDANVHDYLFN